MAMKKVHNYGQSVKAKLLNIARKERQQYQLLLTRYLQERFLYRLSISQHRKHFLLKGGALLYAHEQFYARPTLDIDFMGSCINNDRESVQLVMKEICEITYEQDGVIFLSETLQISDITVDQFNVSILQEAIQATFANRQTEYDPDNIVFTNTFCTNNELSTRWITFMKKLKINTPHTFIEVMDYIQKQLKPYWENLAGNETD